MKHPKLSILIVCVLFLSSCASDAPSTADSGQGEQTERHEGDEIFGARFKEGKGVELSDVTRASLKLETAEVTEETLDGSVRFTLQVVSANSNETEGIALLPKELGTKVKLGAPLEVRTETNGQAVPGVVSKLSTGSLSGDTEALISVKRGSLAVKVGDTLTASLKSTNHGSVTAVPRSALLRAAAGDFVYVVNGSHFLRTEVKTGQVGEDFVEIKDGLYSGDEVVRTPVDLLWYAELQAIRGGVGCADGH